MSAYAYLWAKRQTVGDSSAKSVLKSYAHWAQEDFCAWVSNDELVLDTELDIKTIRKCREKLVTLGYLIETGRREGGTRSIIVYQMLAPAGSLQVQITDPRSGRVLSLSPPSREEYEAKPLQKRSPSKNGAPPNLVPLHSPELDVARDEKGYQNRTLFDGEAPPNLAPLEPGEAASEKPLQIWTPSQNGAPPNLDQKPLQISLEGVPNLDPKLVIGKKEVNDDDACARLSPVDNSESSPSSFSVEAMVESLSQWEIDRGKSPRFNAELPQFAAWAHQGVTPAQLRSAYDLAVAARIDAGDSTAVNAGFLELFVPKVLAPQRPAAAVGTAVRFVTAWVETPEGVTAKAAEIGQPPQQPGEDRHWFRRRVLKAVGDPALIEREVMAAARMNINEHERVHRYFYGCAPGLVII